jgi:hypothetical protein
MFAEKIVNAVIEVFLHNRVKDIPQYCLICNTFTF